MWYFVHLIVLMAILGLIYPQKACNHMKLYTLDLIQSCQPLCFGRSLLHPRALHYAATLMVISLSSPSEKNNTLFLIPCIRVGIKFASNQLWVCLFVSEMLVVPQPVGIHILTSWPIVVFGSIPALMRHFLARRLPFSVIRLLLQFLAECTMSNNASTWSVTSTKEKR